MLREAVTTQCNFKPKSSERGKVWERIAAYLNSLKSPEFRVTARAVRDRYALFDLPTQTMDHVAISAWV